MSLFERKTFVMHSGELSHYKIECDYITDEDWDTLAFIISQKYKFGSVHGVPRGGLKLEYALRKRCSKDSDIVLIVDDVLTTGNSMEEMRSVFSNPPEYIKGVVIFARAKCPDWIEPVFQMWEN